MSYDSLPSGQTVCNFPIYGDSRWSVRPYNNRRGNAGDLEWLTHPLQPSYYETDVADMSHDLNMYTKNGHLEPEVTPDPCYPMPLKYFSFGKSVWRYDKSYPSLTVPSQPCKWSGKSLLPDVACLDQQNLMTKDRLNRVTLNPIFN